MRKIWLITGGVAVAAGVGVAAALIVGGDGGATPGPTSELSPTASPAITASEGPPLPEPSPAAEGAFPVPAYPASAIPWLEVGPGWFLVDWAEAGVSAGTNVLVGPDGSVYATGAGWDRTRSWAMDWVSGGLAVFQNTMPEGEEYGEWATGDVSIIDLQSGAVQAYATGIDDPGWNWETADGTYIGNMSGGDGTEATATKDGTSLGWYCWGYGRTDLSPGGGRLVCLQGREDGQTDVVLAGTTGPSSESVIDVFSRGVFDYSIAGWLDADTFLLSRPEQGTHDDYIVWEGNQGFAQVPAGDGAAYFAYNVATRTIADFALPFTGAYGDVDFYSRSDVFAARSMDATRADFFSGAGAAIASVDCAAALAASRVESVEVSGRRALVTCGDLFSPSGGGEAALVLVDLDEGTAVTLGPVDGQASSVWLRAFPYPEAY